LYTSPNIIRVIKSRKITWAGYVANMEEMKNICNILVGKPERKKPHGTLRHRWEDNIKMGRCGLDTSGLG
jgi:hypothetical protein